jgi:hypothetical protein
LRAKLLHHGIGVCLGLLQRDVAREPRRELEEAGSMLRELHGVRLRRTPVVASKRHLESGRHHAHDMQGVVVEGQRPTDDMRVGSELTHPQAVTNQRGIGLALVVDPAKNGRREDPKKRRRHR